MVDLFDKELAEIDRLLPSAQPSDIPRLFQGIPLDVFGGLLLDVPDKFPNIKSHFPTMASVETQVLWTGAHGVPLLLQTSAFVRLVVSGYEELANRKIWDAKILDFGCGWGRIIRLFYKHSSHENIYGVDPWDESLSQCQSHNVKANLFLSDWVPRNLPFEIKFDLIYAFSVFTHLSEKTMHIALATLRRYVADDGLLVITIRPKEYWHVHDNGAIATEMIAHHNERGFAFIPHGRPPTDGDITYGDTSMALEYIGREVQDWRVVRVEYNLVDPYQVVLFLRPVSP